MDHVRHPKRHSLAAWRLLQFWAEVFPISLVALARVLSQNFSTEMWKKHELFTQEALRVWKSCRCCIWWSNRFQQKWLCQWISSCRLVELQLEE